KSMLPKNHYLYNDQVSGLSACSYFIELSRQANMAICHLFFNVKLDTIFTMISIDWNFIDKQPFLPKNFDPIIYNVEFVTYKARKNFSIAKIVGRLYQKDDNFLNGKSTFLFSDHDIGENIYDSTITSFMQEGQAVDPVLVQVKRRENALITHPEYDGKNGNVKAQMIVDANHEYFFEHPCAHVPGMMMLEAGKQLAIGGLKTKYDFLKDTYGDLKEGRIAFSNFATLHSEVFVEVITQEPNVQSDYVHIPISVVYSQNNQQLGGIEGIASFMDTKEVKKKSAYAS
ncbi:MAG: hypothetical protein MUP22_05100, partial [Desulfobacterales bacterium]|nr:hypothetical protein [Desulfobacterales bacterium]